MRSFEQQSLEQEAPGAAPTAGRVSPKTLGFIIAASVIFVGGIVVAIVLATRPGSTTKTTTSVDTTTTITDAMTTVAIMTTNPSSGDWMDSTTIAASATTETSTKPLARSPAMTSEQAANFLNDLYNGWNTSRDAETPVGVTVTMLAQPDGFFKNIFCSKVFNPYYNDYPGCYLGHADCFLSASVLASGWMRNATGEIASFGNRAVGFVFNQTKTQQKWTRCSSIWDAASLRLYNRGCGDGAANTTCDPYVDSAFNNICPTNSGAEGHTCTKDDEEVSRKVCEGTFLGATAKVPERHAEDPICFFPGPAFNFHGQSDFEFGVDYTHVMARERLRYNSGSDLDGSNDVKTNEVVIDAELFLEDLWDNPISAVPAIVYTKNRGTTGKELATQVRDDLCSHYKCEMNGGSLIPLVMIDDTDISGHPFVAHTEVAIE